MRSATLRLGTFWNKGVCTSSDKMAYDTFSSPAPDLRLWKRRGLPQVTPAFHAEKVQAVG